MEWKKVRTEQGPDLKLFKSRFEWVLHPLTGIENQIVVLESPDAANVIPITPEGNIILIRQFRFGIGEYTIELPGGLVNKGEGDSLWTAKRELLEETGYTGLEWYYLGKIPSNPVFMDCYIHHWILRGAELAGPTNFDEAEQIEILEVNLKEAFNMLERGEIDHPHAVSALFRFRNLIEKEPSFLD